MISNKTAPRRASQARRSAPRPPPERRSLRDERAGASEAFQDAALYDWEYRRRRSDVAFYRRLADEQGGPIADLGCGSGRILAPLLRDGHRVVGVDLSRAMLARAAARVAALGARRASGAVLVHADLRALPLRGKYPLVLAAFHTVQHLVTDRALVAFFRRVKGLLAPNGWFAFDVFFPHPQWLARPTHRRFDRTVFRHPTTGRRFEYSVSHALDPSRQALHMRFHYQPLDAAGRPAGRRRVVRVCHRQLPPETVADLVAKAGLQVLASWGGFENEPLDRATPFATEQHVYLVGAKRDTQRKTTRKFEPEKGAEKLRKGD